MLNGAGRIQLCTAGGAHIGGQASMWSAQFEKRRLTNFERYKNSTPPPFRVKCRQTCRQLCDCSRERQKGEREEGFNGRGLERRESSVLLTVRQGLLRLRERPT